MEALLHSAPAGVVAGVPPAGPRLSISSGLCRTVRLRSEWYDFVSDPELELKELREQRVRADLFTFLQRIPDLTPRYDYPCELNKAAVLPIESYDAWWKSQINDKTRNMVRKATKKGVVLRIVELDDSLLHGIKAIYDESPLRQGRPFKHFAKDLETLRRDHETFVERSEFIGAFHEDQLVGFVKLVFQGGWASMMQIISAIAHRDKAPTNALIAKAVERCAIKGVPLLQYGSWSRGGIGEFKAHHGFQCFNVPRYYVPLTVRGRACLKLGLHLEISDRLPESLFLKLLVVRSKLYAFRFRGHLRSRAAA